MTRRTVNLLQFCLSLTYFLVPLVAFTAARYIRFATSYFPKTSENPGSYVLWITVVTPIWSLVVEKSRLNRAETIMSFRTGVIAMGKAVSYLMAAVLAVFFFYRNAEFSRIFAVAGCVLTFLISLLTLHVFRAVLRSRRGLFRRPLRLAILGVDGYEARVAKRLQSMNFVPVEVGCLISSDYQSSTNGGANGWPVLNYRQVEDAVDIYDCQEVLVALPPSRLSELKEILQPLRQLCIPVRLVLDMGEGVFAPDRIFDFHGLSLLTVRPYPVDTMNYVLGKRSFDLIFSAFALVLAAPLMAVIAAAIKLTSSGPVFFSQERIGLSGKPFKMLKFRTMYAQDAHASNSLHTSRNDPRVTWIGRLLRKTSLDELPQFANVLRGDMSVVGPRPELTFFVQKFRQEIPVYMARHNVKCGITGLAQINGFRGSDTSIQGRIEQDLYYLQNWSMLLDIRIIFKTVLIGVNSKNAY